MEMAVDVKGDEIVGQVRSAGSPGCSVEWGRIAGVSKGDKVFARYNLGGRCGNVDIVFTIEPDGKVMNGSWSSEWPSNGTFRLSKQIALPAANAAGVSSGPAEKR